MENYAFNTLVTPPDLKLGNLVVGPTVFDTSRCHSKLRYSAELKWLAVKEQMICICIMFLDRAVRNELSERSAKRSL